MDTRLFNDTFDHFNCDKGTNHPESHHYGHMYGRVFRTIGTPSSLLEIGVQRGRSIAAWKRLFPEARLVGVDNRDVFTINDGYAGLFPRCPDPSTWEFVLGDSREPDIQTKVTGNFDVIIDDGSHLWHDQVATFRNFMDRFEKAYVIEDIVGARHEQFIRDALTSSGFTKFFTFDSNLSFEIEYVAGQGKENVKAMAMVIFKDVNMQLAG